MTTLSLRRYCTLLGLALLIVNCSDKSVNKPGDNSSTHKIFLNVVREAWFIASPPLDPERPLVRLATRDQFAAPGYRGLHDPAFLWFNPFNQFRDTSIYETGILAAGGSRGVHVLVLEFRPQRSQTLAHGQPKSTAWGGVMYPVSRTHWDLSTAQFLQLRMASVRQGATAGVLHLDLGYISEDVNDNGALDTEDKPRGPAQFRNNLLEPHEDTGLDGVPDSLEVGPNGETYDAVTNPDPVGDNWAHDAQGSYNNYDHIDGTENSIRDPVHVLRPDGEDLGGEVELDRTNAYFEYSIVLDDQSDPALVSGSEKVSGDVTQFADRLLWHSYRIPLWNAERRNVTSYPWIQPDSTKIEFARIWLAGADSTVRVYVAEISLVDTTDSR
jgi:cell surface protein SprA